MKNHSRKYFSKAKAHRAFTLLETVIAMSLLSLLLAVLWSIFGTFTKYDVKGKRAAAKSALVRAVHRQLRDDLIAAVGVNSQLPRSLSATPLDQASQGTPWQPRNGYFVGTASEIHFVAHVAPDSEPQKTGSNDFISTTSINPPTELFRVISYEARLSDEDDESNLDGTFTTQESDAADISFLDDLSEPIDETPLGIDRHVRNWQQYLDSRPLADEGISSTFAGRDITLDQDDFLVIGDATDVTQTTADEATRRAALVDEIPEIRAMFFRYFDGTTWASTWDSGQKGRLPIAIEVGFDLDMTEPEPIDESTDTEEIDAEKLAEEEELARLEREEAISQSNTIDLQSDDAIALEPTWTTEFRWVIALDSILPAREPDEVMGFVQ